MAEYIEREKALESVREKLLITDALPDGIPKDASTFTLASMQHSLESIPAADVRPVVRGRWIWTVADDEYFGEYWKCNFCGEHSYIGYNFCPNCGADMREES